MNAFAEPVEHNMPKTGFGRRIKIHVPGGKFRLCRWNADSRWNPENADRYIIIGEEKRHEIIEAQAHLRFVPSAIYPWIQFDLGTITEFQVFHDGKNKWIPCGNPLVKPSKNFEASLLIIDEGLSQNNRGDYWDSYLNFFEPKFKMIVVGSVEEAMKYLRADGLVENDVVVVRGLDNNEKISPLVGTLRECGFTGQVLGMVDDTESAKQLITSGCSKVFGDKEMSKLIRAVHNR